MGDPPTQARPPRTLWTPSPGRDIRQGPIWLLESLSVLAELGLTRAWPPETRSLAADGSLFRKPETYFSVLSVERQAGDHISFPIPRSPTLGQGCLCISPL